jgi:hypothetical protein
MAVADAMRAAAEDVLGPLDADQRRIMQRPFEVAGERQRWFYTPTDHGGLLLSSLTPQQHQAVDVLIASGLSEGGYNTAHAVMALESILDHVEHWPARPNFRARDPLRYAVTIFGSPSDRTWGWRVGGHHLSLNFTIVGDTVAATPCFMGADPACAPLLGEDVYEPLAGAESLARSIVTSLGDEDRRAAIVAPNSPWDLVLSNRSQPEAGAQPREVGEIFRDDPDVMRPIVARAQEDAVRRTGVTTADLAAVRYDVEAKGLRVADLSDEQQMSVGMLVRHFTGRLADDIASRLVGDDGMSGLHLVWAGSTVKGEPHYYRLHGPTLLIEYVNATGDNGHIHAVLRDPRGDFGVGLLRQ